MEQSIEHLSSGLSKVPSMPEKMRSGRWGIVAGPDPSVFSSSLPVIHYEKLNIDHTENGFPLIEDVSSSLSKLQQEMEGNDSFEDVETHTIGSLLLPDNEDELLAGLTDGYELSRFHSRDEVEDYDLFGFVGGMELENDALPESLNIATSKISLSDGIFGNGMAQCDISNSVTTVTGEHPYGEHPSRTLFVRNINSNVEDSELRTLFEQYGDIRTLYTTCKHRGFVMISYYDIRSARFAMRELQNKPLRRRTLDIHFSIPKDNPSDKDVNQGTLVIFNLDPSVSNDDLHQIFGEYGEIKEIRETPHKRHHKFIEFYDVRGAEAALRALNRSDIAGKQIKLEPSRPGGARRNLMQSNQDLELDDPRSFRHQAGFPITNSPPGNWMQKGSPIESNPLQSISKSNGFGIISPIKDSHLSGLASIVHSQASRGALINKEQVRSGGHFEHLFTSKNAVPYSRSLPESKFSPFSGTPSSFGPLASNSSGMEMETLSRSQFLWGSPSLYPERSNSSVWPTPSVGHAFNSIAQNHGFKDCGHHGFFYNLPQHHQRNVGSAPSSVPLEKHFEFFRDFQERPPKTPAAFGNINSDQHVASLRMNMGARNMNASIFIPGSKPEKGPSRVRMMPFPRLNPYFLGNGLHSGLPPLNMEGLADRGGSQRFENSTNQIDKKQFQLDLDRILTGEDTRTTLMIKNIPNKYTSKMLLAAIDESNMGTYDFVYLPIDFKNKCNVGYAFINMLSHSYIIPFYEALNGKKWEKFNSEKVASLAYARIQGKLALMTHFQNSTLINEDKRCRPILFHTEGSGAGDQVAHQHFPSSSFNIEAHQLKELLPENSKNGGYVEQLEKS